MKVVLERHLNYHKIIKPVLFLIILLGSVLFIFLSQKPNTGHRNDIDVIIHDRVLQTQRADSPEERTVGLSHHRSLEHNEAMLFVFSSSGFYGFHMPDMNFPIDIFWLNEDKEVVFIKENADPQDFPEVYTPTEPARYVLETVAGFAQDTTIVVGDSFSW